MSVSEPVVDYIDLATRHIYLLTGIRSYHPVEDVYTEIRRLRATDESKRGFDVPVTAAGAVSKGGGKYTPRYAIFHNGWRVVPEDTDHTLDITGEQITSEGTSGSACMDFAALSAGTKVFINYAPPAAEIIRDEAALAAIEAMAYNRRVYIDVVNGTDTVEKGFGVLSKPVKTLENVKTITDRYGFSIVAIIGDLDLNTSHNFQRFTFIGESPKKSLINIEATADVYKTEFENASMDGTLDGNSELLYCETHNLNYVDGTITRCILHDKITLSGQTQADFLWCVSGVAGEDTPEIDMGGAGSSMTMRGLEGGILITNKTGPEEVSIDLASGQCRIDMTTVTNGAIVVRGDGWCVDDATGEHIWSGDYGDLTIVNKANNSDASARALINFDMTGYITHNTFGGIQVKNTYNDTVHINTNSGISGQAFPAGLDMDRAVSNIPDALALLAQYHCTKLKIHDDLIVPAGTNLNGVTFIAGATIDRTIIIPDTATTNGTRFKGVIVTGSLNGRVEFKGCTLEDLIGIRGTLVDCSLSGEIGLDDSTGQTTIMARCSASGELGTPTLNIYGAKLSVIDWVGKLTLANKTGSSYLGISTSSGGVFDVAASCTAGFIIVTGDGKVGEDLSGAGCIVIDGDLLNKKNITKAVMTYDGTY